MLETIRSSDEISSLFTSGQRIQTANITLIVRNTEHGREGRVAFIAGKKLGNAVWRNAAKRRMREVCHQTHFQLTGYDVIFLAKRRILEASYSKVVNDCERVLKRFENGDII